MSDNKVTLDQLDNSAVEAMSSSVGDVSMLNTENKTIVGALAEIVGKKEIANAIGEPLAETDKFTEMSSEINGLLSTFKTNMMNAGVVVESGDKFKQLIDKIKGLTEGEGNKGMRFVSGSTTDGVLKTHTHTYTNSKGEEVTSSNKMFDIEIELDFDPSIILVFSKFTLTTIGLPTDMQSITVYDNLEKNKINFGEYSSDNSSDYANSYILPPLVEEDKHYLPIAYPGLTTIQNVTVNQCTWYAIGVGEEDTTLRDSLASILAEEGVNVTEEDDMVSLITKVDEEFDRQVLPAGDATVEDVIAGKTFMNNMGELLTGALVSGLNKIKQGSLKTSTSAGKTLDVSVTNIGFKPSIVIIYCGGASSICIAIQDELFSSFPLNGYMFTPTYSIGAGYLNTLGTSSGDDYYILNNRFKLKIPVHDVSSATVSWIAMGR